MDNEAAALAKYRIEQAEQCLDSARLLAQAGDFRGAANCVPTMQYFTQ